MTRTVSRLWRCVRAALVSCAVLVIVGGATAAAVPISPIAHGPRTVQIVTVPTVVGAVFGVDDALITTGPDGTASVPITAARDLSRLQLVSPGSGLSSGKAEFVRLTRAPDKDGLLRAYALFKISRDVSFTFRDSLGTAVSTERVTSLTIKSSIGESFTMTGDALNHPITLPSERSVAFVNGDSAMKEIYYSIQEVVISGSNTVFRSQQKFFPIETSTFEVETAFYTLTIKTSDSLFGFATGSNIIIRWPDQHLSEVPIRDGRAVLPALPRGDYEMRIDGAGLNTWRPISVSRDQTVELQLISYFDGAVVLMLVLAVAAACIIVGRRRFGSRHSVGDRPDAQQATEVENGDEIETADDVEPNDDSIREIDKSIIAQSEAVAQT